MKDTQNRQKANRLLKCINIIFISGMVGYGYDVLVQRFIDYSMLGYFVSGIVGALLFGEIFSQKKEGKKK